MLTQKLMETPVLFCSFSMPPKLDCMQLRDETEAKASPLKLLTVMALYVIWLLHDTVLPTLRAFFPFPLASTKQREESNGYQSTGGRRIPSDVYRSGRCDGSDEIVNAYDGFIAWIRPLLAVIVTVSILDGIGYTKRRLMASMLPGAGSVIVPDCTALA
jgi:hypothetical protein